MEIFYRRCCREEAERMYREQRIVEGNKEIKIHGNKNRSDKCKWVSNRRKFIQLYSPTGYEKDAYRYCAVIKVKDGTRDALIMDREEGLVRKGPRGGYGIPPELLEWFNDQIIGIEIYDLAQTSLPNTSEEGDNKITLLKDYYCDEIYATFVSFPPHFIEYTRGNKVKITEKLNRERMTWAKTSLLWTLWKSNWGRKEGHERILKIDLPKKYIEFLLNESVSHKDEKAKTSTIIYQYDPDRKIIGRRWINNNERYFAKGGTTIHFGLRGEALRYYLGIDEYENIRDITDITNDVQKVVEERPPLPTQRIYEIIKVEPVELF